MCYSVLQAASKSTEYAGSQTACVPGAERVRNGGAGESCFCLEAGVWASGFWGGHHIIWVFVFHRRQFFFLNYRVLWVPLSVREHFASALYRVLCTEGLTQMIPGAGSYANKVRAGHSDSSGVIHVSHTAVSPR